MLFFNFSSEDFNKGTLINKSLIRPLKREMSYVSIFYI